MNPARSHLTSVLASPGPYVTAYFDLGDDSKPVADEWAFYRERLPSSSLLDDAHKGLDAIDARIGLPTGDDAAGWCAIAAADGTTAVMTAPEPPRRPHVSVADLPYMAPLLEWGQARVPHVVATLHPDVIEVIPFSATHEAQVHPVGRNIAEAEGPIVDHVHRIDAELLVLTADANLLPEAELLRNRLVGQVPLDTDLVVLEDKADEDTGDLADAVVRHVFDQVARATVRSLRDHRFHLAHDSAAEGVDATLDALLAGQVEELLVHDDPDDERLASFRFDGAALRDVSLERPTDGRRQARLVDVAIYAALRNDARIRIIPTTARGPAEGIGAICAPRM